MPMIKILKKTLEPGVNSNQHIRFPKSPWNVKSAFLFFSLTSCLLLSFQLHAAPRNLVITPWVTGQFAVGSTNFTIDNIALTQLLNAGGNAGLYQQGTVSNGQMHYINELLAFPLDSFTFQLQVPNNSVKYGLSAGTSLPYSGYILYPTTATNIRTNYQVLGVPPALPHMQNTGEIPIFANATSKYPLLIYSHGQGSHPTALVLDLLVKLASHGYIVVALYHGDGRFQQFEARQYNLRPLAVKTALDIILAHPDFAAHIDPTRIGGLGESFGGATMMSLLGAKSVYINGPSIIANVPAITTVDPRIKAAATIVPYNGKGFLRFFGTGGIGASTINRPFMANSSNADQTTDYAMVQASINSIPGIKYLVQYNGEPHNMSPGAQADAFTWMKVFLDAFIKEDAAAIITLSQLQSVSAAGADSLVSVTDPLYNTFANNILTLPAVHVGAKNFRVTLSLAPGTNPMQFVLSTATEVLNSPVSSANFANGVLSFPILNIAGSGSFNISMTLSAPSPALTFTLTGATPR